MSDLGLQTIIAAPDEKYSLLSSCMDTIINVCLYFEHDTSDNFGFGLGYDWFVIDIKSEEEFWIGNAQVRFDGPMLFLKGSF